MDTSFIDALNNALIITILALIIAIIALVLALLSIKMPKYKKIAGILGILIFIFAMIAPFIFMTGFQSYLDQQLETYSGPTVEIGEVGFWYSKNTDGIELSLGPSYAWYLMIIAAVFGMIAAIVLYVKQKQPDITTNTMQQQNPPGYPPTQ